MTDTQLTIILAAVPPTVIALGTFWRTIGIHTLVNSNHTSMEKSLAEANAHIQALEKQIAGLIKARDVKAATEGTAPR